jgi:eukaryotic-like serine/threonine-protein kinase
MDLAKRLRSWVNTLPVPEGAAEELEAILQEHPETFAMSAAPVWSFQDLTVEPPASEGGLPALPTSEARYLLKDRLGKGGMGEVWRAHDSVLERTVALKLVHAAMSTRPSSIARFLEETQITGQLQHPGIVPVLDLGRLPDGRHFYTMPVVHGDTLGERILGLHRASDQAGHWVEHEGGSLQRLLGVLTRAADAVAYAHARGVVHRDIKPDNIMVGPFGEALVLDWGIALLTGDTSITVSKGLAPASRQTESAGTPAYMPPEQFAGAMVEPRRADVFALGGVLAFLLTGKLPHLWTRDTRHPVPEPLMDLVERCTRTDALERPADASEVALELSRFLEGAERRSRAMVVYDLAEQRRARSEADEARAQQLADEASAALQALPRFAPAEEKEAWWAQLAQAKGLNDGADRDRAEWEQLLHAALSHEPELLAAREALVHHYLAAHTRAERQGQGEAVRAEGWLRTHATALPRSSPLRRRAERYLEGTTPLRLRTDPPAEYVVRRYTARGPKLVLGEVVASGTTPIEERLSVGSHHVELRAPGRPTVHWPVLLQRGLAGGLTNPEGQEEALELPASVPEGCCYIPAGWSLQGADGAVQKTLAPRRVWVDGFFLQTHPVTMAAFLLFLTDLVRQGELDRAKQLAPDYLGGRIGPVQVTVNGAALVPDYQGELWNPEWPVMLATPDAAESYAAWWSNRTGLSWRLPTEVEWEKAARGADGRRFPWGEGFDPTFCCMRESFPELNPAPADHFAGDVSPYGVRGLGGNVMDWTSDPWCEAPALVEGRPGSVEPSANRTAKGGAWQFNEGGCGSAVRYHPRDDRGREDLGFRLAADLPASRS